MNDYQNLINPPWNILFEPFPDLAQVDGEFFPIETSWRKIALIEVLLFDYKICETYKYYKILDIFYKGKPPKNTQRAIDEFMKFYRCYNICNDAPPYKENKKVLRGYCFEEDGTLLFNAFYKMGIDLTTDDMHWFKFKALLTELPKDCALHQLIYIRTVDISSLDKQQKKYILEYRKKYSLEKTREKTAKNLTLEQRNKAFLDNLKKQGGCLDVL